LVIEQGKVSRGRRRAAHHVHNDVDPAEPIAYCICNEGTSFGGRYISLDEQSGISDIPRLGPRSGKDHRAGFAKRRNHCLADSLGTTDPRTVIDHATYQAPMEASTGMRFVIVNGTVLIDEGKLVPNTFPGKAL
jgi:hypothetical protein